MPRFKLEPVDGEMVFHTARHTYSYAMNLPASAERVWAGLVADRPLQWCRALDASYTSDRPFGVGTTRTVRVHNVLTLNEKFFIWDDDARRHAFYVESSNAPLFTTFAEDYQVTPRARGCQLVWRFAINARPGFESMVALSQAATRRSLLDRLVSDTREHFR